MNSRLIHGIKFFVHFANTECPGRMTQRSSRVLALSIDLLIKSSFARGEARPLNTCVAREFAAIEKSGRSTRRSSTEHDTDVTEWSDGAAFGSDTPGMIA